MIKYLKRFFSIYKQKEYYRLRCKDLEKSRDLWKDKYKSIEIHNDICVKNKNSN